MNKFWNTKTKVAAIVVLSLCVMAGSILLGIHHI